MIRVLTHEIMNTLTPVASLAQTCSSMLDATAATNDIREAIETIGRRSEGLIPYFTTKRDGSGIGLSLSRQIMTAHGGEIAAMGDGDSTVMSLLF